MGVLGTCWRPRHLNSLAAHRVGVREFWSRRPPPPPRPPQTFSIVRPQEVSPQLPPTSIPSHVRPPPYHVSGEPGPSPATPEVKTPEAIAGMKTACGLARHILGEASQLARPGVSTQEIDEAVTRLAFEAGAYPSPLNYRKFPKSVCTSVNNVVCHGIPDSRALEDGDIINIDVTVFISGHHGDCSQTLLVTDNEEDERHAGARRLLEVASRALYVGIDQCGPGRPFSGIGEATFHLYCQA